METTENSASRLLQLAALFLDSDHGGPGFLDRFAATVSGSPPDMALALEAALTARQRAGRAMFAVGADDVRTESTSSGARLTVGVLSARDHRLATSLRVLDASHAALPGVAVRVTDLAGEQTVVTNEAGRADLRATGASVFIQIGDFGEAGGRSEPGGAVVLPLRQQSQDVHDPAASDQSTDAATVAPSRWRTEVGGVEFMCLSRKGGSDLTLLLRDQPPDLAAAGVGSHGVLFDTWGRAGYARRWIVPLAPSPHGFTGSLHGTDEDWLHRSSVQVYGADDIADELGDVAEHEAEEVVSRSMRHADALHAWHALSKRISPGRQREVIEAAIEKHSSAS